MQKILITGHTGFLGNHLLISLLRNYEVIGISNKVKKPCHMHIKNDIRKITIRDIPKDIKCIIHLAALSDFSYCQNNPKECLDVNVNGTINMLEVARKLDAGFIFPSTSHVYGIPKKLPITEEHPKNPTSLYATSKLVGEELCKSYANTYGLSAVVVRFFSIYGPMSPEHLVTSKLISQILTKNKISIGNLYPRRDFVYVDDAVSAISIILEKLKGFNIFNVGSGKSYSIKKIYEILCRVCDRKVPVVSTRQDSRKFDIENVVADSSKIRQLGWEPKVDIECGLKMTVDWYKNQLHLAKYSKHN